MAQATAISSHLTIGMDLGDKTCEVCVLALGRKKPLEVGSVPMTPAEVTGVVVRVPSATVVVEKSSGPSLRRRRRYSLKSTLRATAKRNVLKFASRRDVPQGLPSGVERDAVAFLG